MIKGEAKKRIEKLKKLINYHRYLYHVLDREEISQAALDSLKKELFDLEQKFPEFITPDSPSQRIAGKPLKKFEKVRHCQPMLSFNDAFSTKDIEDWFERNSKFLTKEEASKTGFFCEPKLDGLAIELIYEKGIFKTGSTRGDGIFGEDITQNLKTIETIPLKLEIENLKLKIPPLVVVRGEAVITKKNFKEINEEQIKKGLPPFANSRNLAAGSLRQLDPKVSATRKLDVVIYDLITDVGQETHEQEHKILQAFGFKTNNKYSRYCANLAEVFEFYDFLHKNREKLPYEIDGVVIIFNENKIFEKLGVVGKAPRGAIAYKFPLKQATTIIEDIKVQVGRTGAITPVACLKPVKVGGVLISRATLHNEEEIKRLGVKIGDTVIVGRAGDVIPAVIRVLPELRTGKEKEFHFPKKCPICQEKLTRPEDEIMWRCPNSKCFARQKEYFYHFVKAFNILGLGSKIIDKLIDKGLVSDPADLFKLKEGDILSLKGFAEKSAQNLISAIQSKKKISLSKFIYALGIRNVGEETAELLAQNFPFFDFQNISLEKWQQIKDIGPIVARNIYNWFQDKRNLEFLEKLKKVGVEIISQRPKTKSQKLKGLTFVFTGGLEIMSREEAKMRIKELGGNVSDSVSKKTTYIVVGEKPGSKLEKAREFNIKIISEKDFLKLITN